MLLVRRIEVYFGRDHSYERLMSHSQGQLRHYLEPILVPRFAGKGAWHDVAVHKVLMSFARRRPRDLVKLLTFAGRRAVEQRHPVIETGDLEAVFEQFSQGRLRDTVNEFGTELPQLERLLMAMKPAREEKTAAANYVLTTDLMLKKLRNVLQNVDARFASGHAMTPVALLAFLYKIDFLQARKTVDGQVIRRYFDQNHLLTPDAVDVGFEWEIQLAFRWVLQPDRIDAIFRFVDPPAAGEGY